MERSWIGCYWSNEISSALKQNYRIIQRICHWKWDRWSNNLFKTFLSRFAKQKEASSKVPEGMTTAERAQQINDQYPIGIPIRPEDCVYNESLRWISKISMNRFIFLEYFKNIECSLLHSFSFWGKMALSSDKTQMIVVNDYAHLRKLHTDTSLLISKIEPVRSNC
jgi:hypothetical protein